jgi:hypothetical protein
MAVIDGSDVELIVLEALGIDEDISAHLIDGTLFSHI